MLIPRSLLAVVLCLLLGMSSAAHAATASKVEIIPANKSDEAGDVSVTWDDGKSERLTKGAHAEQPKLGPDGLIGWVWSKERHKDLWISEHLRVQRGKQQLFDVKSGKPFIEDWGFIPEGVAVKSRAMHGPALIELFSVTDGKRIKVIEKAYGDDLPAWAKPYNDD